MVLVTMKERSDEDEVEAQASDVSWDILPNFSSSLRFFFTRKPNRHEQR